MSVEHKKDELRIPDTVPAEFAEEVAPKEAPVKGGRIWGLLRIGIGWTFLWPFLDKTFALGFATGRNAETGAIDFFGDAAWINGASPTEGYLAYGTKGPFAEFFQGLAGTAWVDWAFMLSLALIGTALVLGIGVRLAAVGGIILMAMLYVSALWPENNPFMDDHVLMALVLVGLAYVSAGRYLGLGLRWEKTSLVERFPVLK